MRNQRIPEAKSPAPRQRTTAGKSAIKANQSYSFMGVEIEINHDCNRACAYCPNSVAERKAKGQMDESLFVHIMKQLQALDYRGRISYHFYNEPLLSPKLDRFVELTREYLPQSWIEIYSNGTLLTEPRLMKLLSLGVDKFTITRHHGIKDFPFEAVFKKLSPAIQGKIKYQGYKELLLTSRGGFVRAGRPNIKPPLDLPCLIPSSLLVITVTGNIVPCFEDYAEQNVMGNITEKPLLEIWNSPRYQKFRSDLKLRKRDAYPVCKDCNCTLIIQ